ncbi:MAG: hypothetical protein B6245_07115 [Desulfobacteraceae bacterium 4572_88]|nr:MAG: hypothetical protein B6245_07115 [Desulfobacteraceae bacterium 4572_88]
MQKGNILRIWFFPLIPIFLILISGYDSGADTSYSEQLIQTAREKKLCQEKYWRILLHYKKTLSGYESLIDDPRFFLAEDGKTNPQSEIEATITALFARATEEAEEHPICRFIARYVWLREKLNIDESELWVSTCEKFDQVVREIRPKSATLVFPTYYMNSPASMFGHTLLNIETDTKSKLLSHAVNYAAITEETNGIFFAVKGLFGFYKGYYSILPYYQKIQEYSDISQRDIWEYPLNLTESEMGRMTRHLWELHKVYTDYYFFDENCSYNLLFLLESARPSVNLTNHFRFWVLPIDTIKAIKDEGLITDPPAYRPSKATKVKYKASLLSAEQRKIVLDIMDGKTEPQDMPTFVRDKTEQIKITDIAAEYLQYRYAMEEISKSEYQNILLKILKVRSRLGKPAEKLYHISPPPQPDNIHETGKFSIGLGVREGDMFQEIGYRPVFSDLLDGDYGYAEGIQIEFGSGKLRYYYSDKELVLDTLNFIDILSLSPRDILFRPYSWKVNTGFVRKTMSDGDASLVYRLNTGGGFTFHHDRIGLYYLFAEPELNMGGALKDGHAIGLGLSGGLLKNITSSWKCHLSAKTGFFEFGDRHRATRISLSQRMKLNIQSNLRLEISWEKSFDKSHSEALVSWNIFF